MRSTYRTLALFCGFSLITAGMLHGADWPQWRGVNRDAKVTEFTAPASWPKELTQIWKVTIGAGDSTPALVGDKLYVFTRDGNDEVTTCLRSHDRQAGVAGQIRAQHCRPRRGGTASGDTQLAGCRRWKSSDLGRRPGCFRVSMPPAAKSSGVRNSPRNSPRPFPSFTPPPRRSSSAAWPSPTWAPTAKAPSWPSTFPAATFIKWKWDGDGPCYGSPNIMTVDGVKQIVDETEKERRRPEPARRQTALAIPLRRGRRHERQQHTPPRSSTAKPSTYPAARVPTPMRIEKQGDTFAAKELWNNPQAAIQYNTPVLVNDMLFGFSNRSLIFCLSHAKDGKTLWTDTTNYNLRGLRIRHRRGDRCCSLRCKKGDLLVLQPSDQGLKRTGQIQNRRQRVVCVSGDFGKRHLHQGHDIGRLVSVAVSIHPGRRTT